MLCEEKKPLSICLVGMYWMCCGSLGCPIVIGWPGSISRALYKGPVVQKVLSDARSSGVTVGRKLNISK